MSVLDPLKDRFDRMVRELKEFASYTIKVGYQDPTLVDDNGTLIVQIAIWNEYGTTFDDGSVHIPARPFISSAVDAKQKEIGDAFAEAVDEIIAGKRTALQAAKRIGIFGVQIVRERIRDSPNWAQPNAQATIDRKGSSKPLVDTGEMLGNCTWIVEKGGSVIASG